MKKRSNERMKECEIKGKYKERGERKEKTGFFPSLHLPSMKETQSQKIQKHPPAHSYLVSLRLCTSLWAKIATVSSIFRKHVL